MYPDLDLALPRGADLDVLVFHDFGTAGFVNSDCCDHDWLL